MPKDGLTGGLLEHSYFGSLKLKTDEQKRVADELLLSLMPTKRDAKQPPYLSFQKALEFTKKLQPWDDPTMPEPKVARDLLNSIAEELGIEQDSPEESELKFYTAVGGDKSPLDFYHHVDAFIEYKGSRVLIDVTRNPNKRFEDSIGEHIIMEELPNYGDPKERAAYRAKISEYAKFMAKSIQNQELSRETNRAYRIKAA